MDKSTERRQNRGQVSKLTLVWLHSSAITQVAQSLGEDPVTELNTEGLPNRRPSSTDITQLSMKILQSVPGTKGIKFSVAFVARAAFLVCYPAPPPCL